MTAPRSAGGRVLALDVGERRLGVAVSDPTGTLASPVATVQRTTPDADAAALRRLADTHDATLLLIGLPLSLDGREGPAARAVRAYAATLTEHLHNPQNGAQDHPHEHPQEQPQEQPGGGLEVRFADERLSTVAAQRHLAEQGVRGQRQRRVVDQAAASVFLQTWLDARHAAARGAPGGDADPAANRAANRARKRGGEMDVPG